MVPDGAISISLARVTVLAAVNASSRLIGAPNFSAKRVGSIFCAKATIARFSECSRSEVMAHGPMTPAVLQAVSNRP
jgi:hypothetical protein